MRQSKNALHVDIVTELSGDSSPAPPNHESESDQTFQKKKITPCLCT